MKILLIDDDKELTTMLKFELENKDYMVDIAYDGTVGMKQSLEKKYNLIILDIVLLGIDGIGLYKEIRNNMDTPVLMITSNMNEESFAGFNGSANDYLIKPFSINTLLSKINSLSLQYEI